MPSASTNSNNKNKLMKQASFGCSSNSGGGSGGSTSATNLSATSSGGSGGGGAISTTVPAAIKVAMANVSSNVSIISATAAIVEINNTNNNNSETNINAESSIIGKAGEKSATSSSSIEPAIGNPMRQALITIEHKIRNLEKRKTKLESYRLIQSNGKELSSDQKAAVAKYDAVMATLDFARDLSKQMLQFSKDAEKEQKKQARKDLIAKAQAETAKIREVLAIQNILSCFSDDSVRSDFLNGENGAIKLESTDLEALVQFCFDIQTRRPESSDDPTFLCVAQKVAEFFSMTIDGRPKQYGETTFENLRRIFNQIQECGYLDKIYLTVTDSLNTDCGGNEEEHGDSTVTGGTGAEDSNSRIMNSLDDNMEKLNLNNDTGINNNSIARCSPINATNYVEQPEQNNLEQATHNIGSNKEHQQQLEHLQKSSNALSMPPQSVISGGAVLSQSPSSSNAAQPLMAGVTNFSAPMQPPPPNRQRSETTTPVHVTAIYAASQAGVPPQQQQPVPPQLQQVVPQPPNAAAAMMSGLPPQQPNQVAMPLQHRQQPPNATSGGGGVSVQLPQGVTAGIAAPMRAGPTPPGAPFHLTTVRAVEQDFFKQHQQQQQQQQKFVQQMHPLAEVIGAGSFYFLQDSELESPEIIGGASINNNNSGGNASVVFEGPAPNMLVHVPGDVPLTGTAIDLQQQQHQQQSKKLGAQQQPPAQQQQLEAQHHTLQQAANLPPQPISTQTFTNQTFPPIQAQLHHQRHEALPSSATAIVPAAAGTGTVGNVGGAPMGVVNKTATVNSGSNGNTPTAQLFQQQGPQSKAAAPTAAMYTPELVMANKSVVQQQQQLQQQQQQQPIMIMARLATPQARLPMQTAANVPQQQQQQPQPFPFDPIVASFGGYEQVQQQLVAQQKPPINATAGIPNIEDKNRKISGATDTSDPAGSGSSSAGASDWKVTIKGHRGVNNNAAVKAAALTSALKQHSSGQTTTVAGGGSAAVVVNSSPLETGTNNKWSTEMNALSARGNTPPNTTSNHNNHASNNSSSSNNNNNSRKNEWSSTTSAGSGGGSGGNGGGAGSGSNSYGNDVAVSTHSDNSSNHWNSNQTQQQPQHDSNTGSGGGYGRSGGGSGRNSNNAYQRRNDDRRGERSSGGGGGGGGGGGNNSYRSRTNNNYGGSQSQQQNGGGRGGGGGGGMYFRNNDGTQSGATNSFYQNGGGIYAKDGNSGGPRYDNGGNNSYRGQRGGNTNQRNQGPPRSIGRNAGNGSNNSTGGGGNGSGGSGGYMHPRQTNRMSLGLEKN